MRIRHTGECQYPVKIVIHYGEVNAMEKQPCVYILTNKRNGTLYVGVTSNLPKRIWEHNNKVVKGFTLKYGLNRLVWYERHETMGSAIQREKAMKFWLRQWKLKTIEEMNPDWRDLYEELN
jgi:putative endonuclease